MDAPAQVEQELALEDVQRLLERMDVRRDPAARMERPDREVGVDGTLVRTDDTQTRQARRRGAGGGGFVREGPVDVSDVVHQRLAHWRSWDGRRTALPGLHRRLPEPARPGVEADGQQEDDPERDLLVERVHAEQVEPVGHERDEQAADDRPLHGPLAAEDARPADDDAGQHGEGQELAAAGLGAQDTRGVQRAGEPAAIPLRANVATRIPLTRTPPRRAAWVLPPVA